MGNAAERAEASLKEKAVKSYENKEAEFPEAEQLRGSNGIVHFEK